MLTFGAHPKGGLVFTGNGIHVSSPTPQETVEKKERDKELFIANYQLFWENRERIFATPELYDAKLSFPALSCAYFGGGPLSLGILLELWDAGYWTAPCPECGGTCRVTYWCGSPLSGMNYWWGFCLDCGVRINKNIYRRSDEVNDDRGFSNESHRALDLIKKHSKPIIVKDPPVPSDFRTWSKKVSERYESGAVVPVEEPENEIIPVDDTKSLEEVIELLACGAADSACSSAIAPPWR